MPLFKKHEPVSDDTPETPAPEPARLPGEAAIVARLDEELSRAARYGRDVSVLRIRPQLLPGQTIGAAECAVVDGCIAGQLRDTDCIGLMDDQSYVAILPESGEAGAQAVAQRIASELTLRSAAVNHRKWLVGATGCNPRSMTSVAALAAALAATHETHRRAA